MQVRAPGDCQNKWTVIATIGSDKNIRPGPIKKLVRAAYNVAGR